MQYVKKTIVTYSDHQWHVNKWQLFQFLSLSDNNGHLVTAQNGYNAGMNIKSWQHGSYVWIRITVLTSPKHYPVESNIMQWILLLLSYLVPLISNNQNIYKFEHYSCIYNKHFT